jgi:protein-S-isoprenylcysteine O-methyltransferase Ste14
MYAAALLLIWSSILGHWSLVPVIIGLIVTGEIALRIMTEEQFLRTRFSDYAAYAHKTKRIIPFLI